MKPTKPINLKCENLENPIGIDFQAPRLSWQIESNVNNVFQTAYQIIFSENEDDILNGIGSLWDSGKVNSEQSHLINYAGPNLKSSQRIFWAVKLWDNYNNESNFSAPAFFETALLDNSDWSNAKWIGRLTDVEDKENEKAPLIRKNFSLNSQKSITFARVYISGLGFYELFINDKKVGNRLLDPAVTRYDKRVFYSVYDIKDYLLATNAIGVILGNGFYNQFINNAWNAKQAPWRNCPALLLKILIKYSDGTEDIIVSDTSWKISTGPIIFNHIYLGEIYDANLEKDGWLSPNYDDTDWKNAVLAIPPKGKLKCHYFLPIKITETFFAKKITEPKPGVFVADLGLNFAGWINIKIKAKKGQKIILKYAERINQSGLIDNTSIKRLVDEPEKFQTDTFIAKSPSEETYAPRFNYHGFQYVQIEGLDKKPELKDITGCFLHTAFKQTGKFKCSNQQFNRIQDCALRSYRSNFHHLPTDCPHREKNGWMADAHLAAEMGLRNFDSATAYAKWMDDIVDEQREDGNLPGVVPTSGWGYDWGNGPAWCSAHTLICWYIYLNTGDKNILVRNLPTMIKYMDYLETIQLHYDTDNMKIKGGIINEGLGDWLPPAGFPEDGLVPAAFILTSYYHIIAKTVSEIAKVINDEDNAKKFQKKAAFIKENFDLTFFIPSIGIYSNGTMAAHSAAIYQKLVSNENLDAVVNFLIQDVERMDYHPVCGAITTKFLLHVLSENGRVDLAYKIANQKTYPSWGYWLEKGATTLFESWQCAGSLNHIFLGDISHWFYKFLAGIQIDEQIPGYKHFFIAPNPVEDLNYVEAEQQTPYGKIKVSWKIENDNFLLDVFVPHNSTATVNLPDGTSEKVSSGKHNFVCKEFSIPSSTTKSPDLK